jgi:uncharacterized membrane protein YdbT with pleckstrin-like domain
MLWAGTVRAAGRQEGSAVSRFDKLIQDDEQIVRHLHPHWITLVPAVFMLLVTVGLGSFLISIMPDGSAQGWLRLAVAVVAVLFLIGFVLVPFLRWRTTHYVITTHRVLIRTGILNHEGHDIPLQRLNDVAFEQSIWDRMLGAGTLTIESAGEHGQETLRNIPHADRNQQLINRLAEEDSDRRSGRFDGSAGYEPGADGYR